MRRADRLFEIVHYLRGRRLTTAAQLAQWLEVSERTVYRDIADLLASGVPIDGEAGVGYRLRPDFDLPPLMFNRNEIEALVIGARMVESWGGPGLAQGARSALAKIATALPNEKRTALESSRLFSPSHFISQQLGQHMDVMRTAIDDRRRLHLDYRDNDGKASQRFVQPLGLFFWGGTWTLGAWCELRSDFRNFRLDRIVTCTVDTVQFPDEPGRRLADFMRAVAGQRDRAS